MTFTPAGDVIEVYSGPECWECGGPCWQWKGSEHGWRCRACLDAYLDASVARAEAKDRRDRERLARKMINGNDSNNGSGGRRREGAGSALCAAAPSLRPRTGDHSTQGEDR